MQQGTSALRRPFFATLFNPFVSTLNWFRNDARHYQVVFQLVFILYGIFILGWDIPLLRFNILVLACLAIQGLYIHFKGYDWTGLKSGLITAFSITLMMKGNDTWVFVLAAALGLGSKFFLRIKGKHIFNPANFGIIVTYLLTRDVWISPGQWGSDGTLLMLVGCLGLIVLYQVKRLDTAFAFLITFLALSFARSILYQGWPMDFFWHTFTTGSLLLFTFFMITDPMSTPSSRKARIIWSILVGALAWWLSTIYYVHTAPLWALFILSPLTPLFDKFLPGKKFQWVK